MGKPGRKPKPGARYPSGKLKPAARPSTPPITPAEWQRIVQHGHLVKTDKRLQSELGRLYAAGELTIVQCTAGHRIAEIYGAYERAIGRRRSAKSPSYERSFSASEFESEARAAYVEAVTETFLDLQVLFSETAPPLPPVKGTAQMRPHRLIAGIEDLCVEDRSINSMLYAGVRSLLEAVAREFGISKRPGGGRRAGSSTTAPPAPTPADASADRARTAPSRRAFIGVLAVLRPDMTAEQINHAYDVAQALKDRADFVESSAKLRRAPENSAVSRVHTRLDRPFLKLPEKNDA